MKNDFNGFGVHKIQKNDCSSLSASGRAIREMNYNETHPRFS